MGPIIDVRNIKKTYNSLNGEIVALDGVNFDINKGEFVSIIGPSGCGKSTLLSILSGLIKPTYGEVEILGENKRIGYMLQRDTLLNFRTVKENTLLGLKIINEINNTSLEYVDMLLNDFGLYEFKDKYPNQLSGGMKQRVSLIRSLALRPDILLLDEAFSALDYQTRIKLSSDVLKILKKMNKTAILVTHNISESVSLSDKIIILSDRPGKVKKEIIIDYGTNERDIKLISNDKKYNEYMEILWLEVSNNEL